MRQRGKHVKSARNMRQINEYHIYAQKLIVVEFYFGFVDIAGSNCSLLLSFVEGLEGLESSERLVGKMST